MKIGCVEAVADAFALLSHCHPATECAWNDRHVVGVLDVDCDDSGFCSWSDAQGSESASFDAVCDLLDVVVGFPDVKPVEDIQEVVESGEWVVVVLVPSPVVACHGVDHP